MKWWTTNYKNTYWVADVSRKNRLKKIVHGLLQQSKYRQRYDQMGKHIIPPSLKKNVIHKDINNYSELIKVYNTDGKVLLDRVLNYYYFHIDMQNMLRRIKKTRGIGKRSVDVFLEYLYRI